MAALIRIPTFFLLSALLFHQAPAARSAPGYRLLEVQVRPGSRTELPAGYQEAFALFVNHAAVLARLADSLWGPPPDSPQVALLPATATDLRTGQKGDLAADTGHPYQPLLNAFFRFLRRETSFREIELVGDYRFTAVLGRSDIESMLAKSPGQEYLDALAERLAAKTREYRKAAKLTGSVRLSFYFHKTGKVREITISENSLNFRPMAEALKADAADMRIRLPAGMLAERSVTPGSRVMGVGGIRISYLFDFDGEPRNRMEVERVGTVYYLANPPRP